MKFFPLSRVRLLESPFSRAVRTDLDYVLSWEPDRLLAPFLREAGLEPRAENYGSWESTVLAGHIGGHCLSALALLAAATGEAEPRRRLDYMVAELDRAQTHWGTGYLGGVTKGAALFEDLRGGGIEAARELGRHWAPWYSVHKTFAGLIDAHRLLGHEQALEVVTRLADWWLDIAEGIDDEAFEAMLDTEFGGMNEAFADLAAITGRRAYADMAVRFSHRAILDPLLKGRDELTGLHANTQIPKAVGYAATAAVRGDEALLAAAECFWREVVEHRTVANGGNSVREHFHARDDFTLMIEDRTGPETCNTYNMLKLTKALAESAFDPSQLDYAERAVYNHQLASQHPEHGGLVYFTPMRPRHYRVYSQLESSMWCCVGTGIEMQAKYGEFVFGEHDGALAVNLYTPAVLDAPEFGGRFRLETGFPADEHVRLTVDIEGPRTFPLRLRVPAGCDGPVDLTVNGRPVEAGPVPGAVVLEREWRSGDVLAFRLPLRVRAERLPDGSPWQAYFAGPVLLASKEGTAHLTGLRADDAGWSQIGHGALVGVADLPIIADSAAEDVLSREAPLRYRLRFADPAGEAELVPLYEVHDSRYTVYWPVAAPDKVARRRDTLVEADRGPLALDAATVDAVAFGEQQPETDHGFRGEATLVAVDAQGRRARTTTARMSVVLNDPERAGRVLRIGFRHAGGSTGITVHLEGIRIAEETWEDRHGDTELDFGLLQTSPACTLEIAAPDGKATPGITTVRLLR
ncbi:beta-L-arabinofuranosidase domain-containing protein [Glycomyces sp. NPDC048151]|uniref:beta-L-arabinofuranosidase domain-containing protein n=1 Tax=Glycomyces sp. NPDC048151 TaxID=3364002 RepID=UPI00371B62AD